MNSLDALAALECAVGRWSMVNWRHPRGSRVEGGQWGSAAGVFHVEHRLADTHERLRNSFIWLNDKIM